MGDGTVDSGPGLGPQPGGSCRPGGRYWTRGPCWWRQRPGARLAGVWADMAPWVPVIPDVVMRDRARVRGDRGPMLAVVAWYARLGTCQAHTEEHQETTQSCDPWVAVRHTEISCLFRSHFRAVSSDGCGSHI